MKWAILDTDLKEIAGNKLPVNGKRKGPHTTTIATKNEANIKASLAASYRSFSAGQLKEFANPLHEWVTYKFNQDLSRQAKEQYEIFCGGFLTYYDDIIRNAVVDHTIYLQWGEENVKGKTTYSVTIFMVPPAQDPIKGKYTGISMLNPQALVLKELAPSSFGFTKDPPAPPPPPPPAL